MPMPSLRSIHVYPVKSLAGGAPVDAVVEPWGLAGDRRWMLADAAGRQLTQRQQPRLALVRAEHAGNGAVRLTAPGMPPLTAEVPPPGPTRTITLFSDKVETTPADRSACEWVSAYLGIEAELVHLADPARDRPVDPAFSEPGDTVSLADGFPLLVTTTASLDALNSLVAQGDHADEGPLPMNRFRPNIVVDGTAPWAEDDWRVIRVGEVTFQVVKPCGRCVVTTTDQHTAERGKEPLRTLARHRRFGDQLVFGQNLIPRGAGTIRVGDPVEILG
ncbi:MOSC N-terminal beta barrel domain-containing protein [Streptomyces sp. NPDC003077]|uniref:MOSC domain-containing protein n=1 Tax=Streptomyces sp. NPDC003077 TaxID=3154443 RepID=UPI0033B741A6